MNYLAVQIVDVKYGKAERGGEGARARARLPRALPLPPGDGRGVLHQCGMVYWEDFAPRVSAGPVPLGKDGGMAVHLRFYVDPVPAGLRLARYLGTGVRGPELATIPVGQWGRLRWNSREQTYEHWWYHEFTVNLGEFAGPPDNDVFLGEPDVLVDLRRDLLRLSRRKIRRA